MFEQALCPPAPDVLPWDEYVKFVSKTVQKKLGHKKQIMNGRAVVIMPAKAGTPWKLQTKYAEQINNEETLLEQRSSDSEDECTQQFTELAEKHAEDLKEATKKSGTLEELMALVAAEEKSKPESDAGLIGSRIITFEIVLDTSLTLVCVSASRVSQGPRDCFSSILSPAPRGFGRWVEVARRRIPMHRYLTI